MEDNNILQKTTEHYKRLRKYRKEKSVNISRLLKMIIDNLESRSVLIYKLADK